MVGILTTISVLLCRGYRGMHRPEQIFIVGYPRSGTTLLQLILSNHSEIAIAPETHFFRLFWSRREEYGDLSDDENFDMLCNDLANSEYIKNLQIPDYEYLIRASNREGFYKHVFSLLLRHYACMQAKGIYGEKTPSHLEYVPNILSMFSQAKIINVYRNPFDVAASIRKVPWGSNDVIDIVKRWKGYVKLACEYEEKFKRNFYSVKYEDVVLNPNREIGRVCDFLDVAFEGHMLEFWKDSEVPIFNKHRLWHENCFQPISRVNVGKGFSELAIEDIRFISHYSREYISVLGYGDLLREYEKRMGLRVEGRGLFDMKGRVRCRYLLFMRSAGPKRAFAALKRIKDGLE